MKIIKKRMLMFLFIGIVVLSGLTVFADQSVNFHVERTVSNDVVAISVEVPENSGLTNGKIVFSYDNKKMTFATATAGAVLNGMAVDINTKVPGIVSIAWVGEAITQKGSILDMTFNLVDSSTSIGNIDMTLGAADLYADGNTVTASNDMTSGGGNVPDDGDNDNPGGGGSPANPTNPTNPTNPAKPTEPEKPSYSFTDVDNHWAKKEIYAAVEAGLFVGTSDTTFSPEAKMNRGMFVTVLYRMQGSPEVTNRAKFSDVDSNAWYADAVAWAYENGIVNGKGDSTFAPLSNISREEMITMLARYAKYTGIDTGSSKNISSYIDSNSVSSWAKDSISWAIEQGLITGKPGNIIDPKGLATRAECAVIFVRYNDK